MRFDLKLFLGLCLGFIACVIIGTLSHECGHYIAIRLMGCEGMISYNFTTWWCELTPGRQVIAAVAGPFVSMLIGTIGASLLLYEKKEFISSEKLQPARWIMVFTALFWLRPILNFGLLMFKYLLHADPGHHSDEARLSDFFDLPEWSVPLFTALLGAVVIRFIFFRIIPFQQRVNFLLSGIAGGALGIFIWMYWLGPVLLPPPEF
jgi:hypothetical protein